MNTREEGSSSAETPEFSGDTLNGVPLVSDTHHLLLHPGAKQFLILLSATGTKPGSFNLWKHADALPYHKLYLRVPINDWYQQGVPGLGADPEETYASIRRLIEGTAKKLAGEFFASFSEAVVGPVDEAPEAAKAPVPAGAVKEAGIEAVNPLVLIVCGAFSLVVLYLLIG